MARLTRRGLLIGGGVVLGAAVTGLAVGFGYLSTVDMEGLHPSPSDTPGAVRLNAWIEILRNGQVRLLVPHTEMGQGIHTGLAMLVAEELEVSLASMIVEHPVQPLPVYANFVLALHQRPEEMSGAFDWVGRQLIGSMLLIATGGSTSMVRNFVPLRRAGAVARNLLEQAAANRLGVPRSQVRAEAGQIVHADSENRLSYGELAAEAALLQPDDMPALKQRAAWKVIGTGAPRLDTAAKSNGTARFAIDQRPAGLLFAHVVQPPIFGARLEQAEIRDAESAPGVEKVVVMGNAVGIIAKTTWHAFQAAERLVLRYADGEHRNVSSSGIVAEMRAAAKDRLGGQVFRDEGDVARDLAEGKLFEAQYETPYLANATMEPASCVAELQGDVIKFWSGSQSPMPMMQAARALGHTAETHITLAGGGFGRRVEGDVVDQAARLALEIPGRPVLLTWPRESDMRHGTFRPAAVARLVAATDPDGRPKGLDAMVATQSVSLGYSERNMPIAVGGASDRANVEGLAELAYEIPSILVRAKHVATPVPVGFWRSVGHSNTAFFVESFIDELAHGAAADPLAYRMALLQHNPRLLRLCQQLSNAAQWSARGAGPPKGRGVAIHSSFRSCVGQVVDVTVSPDKQVKLDRIVAVIDCGVAINPQQVRAQVEGAIGFALSAAMTGEIVIEGGRVVNSNFHDYPMALMKDFPAIETTILASDDPPGGVGEPGTPPLFPALANAIFAATGERIRTLPLSRHGFGFA